ncbi:hypothetical protein AgCh_027718 [Apium graveolens]
MALTCSDDYRHFAVTKGHGVKGISDLGLNALPEQHVQPPEERIDIRKVLSKETIPVIDMLNFDDPNVANHIADAAEEWGFFQIINHGIPLEVLDNTMEATRRFFELPLDEKIIFSQENFLTKNVRLGTSFAPKEDKVLEWKDYLSLFNEVLEFMKKSEFVIKWVLKALMQRLKVEIDSRESLLMGSKRINLNYYPICPNPELAVGVSRHSDASTFTFLLQDSIGGLYVQKMGKESAWIYVPPISGSVVINVGDALEILSNGKYKSVEHRVAANGNSTRISVPIFVNPLPECYELMFYRKLKIVLR